MLGAFDRAGNVPGQTHCRSCHWRFHWQQKISLDNKDYFNALLSSKLCIREVFKFLKILFKTNLETQIDIIIDYLWRSKWNIIMISTVSAIIYFLYLKFCPLLDVVETIGPECLLILKSICENTTVSTIVFGYFILVLFAPEFANRLPVILSIPMTCIFNVMLVSYIFRSDSKLFPLKNRLIDTVWIIRRKRFRSFWFK